MSPRARLLTEQRRRNLLDLVDQNGQVTVADLVKRFSISAVTVRSDLDALASIGAIVRSHGGAVRRLEATQDYPLRTKEALHHIEKVRIGKAAAELVRAGETIILDSGSTTAEIARHLKKLKLPSLTVITNALNIAAELADLENGPSTPDVLEAQLNNVMIRSAKEVNVVADFSKLGRRSVSKIGPFDRIRRLITDKRAATEFTEGLRKKGIEVIEV